ncbi:MAG: ABC transporter permease [Deltaproteobacteria bacterium]|nr:ABC transporter permease [Deltaproteobacteria bacterium]
MAAKKQTLFRSQTLADAGYASRSPKALSGPVEVVQRIGAMGVLLGRTVACMATARVDKRESWRMAHRFTNESVTFVVVAMSFVGMIMVYQSTMQLTRAVGDTHLVGASFLKLLIRVLGPTVVGLLVACRVGAGIAAEIGAMAVTDQLDAMRMCAADPIEALMVPRLRGGLVAGVALAVIGSGASMLAGLLTGMAVFAMSPGTYWNFDLIGISDLVQGLAKALVYGAAVPIIAGACGLHARGGARGVGQATTDAVVGSSVAIVVLDSVISLVSYVAAGT